MSSFLTSLLVGMVCCVSCLSTLAADPLQVGFAETDITPPIGFPIAGYYHERLAEGTIDPLKAKAIVFRGETEQAALVVCDLAGICIDLATHVRAEAAERTGIPAGNIVVAATHSHTAPDYWRDLSFVLAGKPRGPLQAEYIDQLIHKTADAIVLAHEAAVPATLAAGSAQQQFPVSFNRRFVMRDGSVRTWMYFSNSNVLRAAGPIDPEIGLLLAKSSEGKPLGVLSNFALHLDTVGGKKWSADYPFFIEQVMRKALGPDVVSVFGIGTCGDINHSDPNRPERNKTDVIGNALGMTIESQLSRLQPVTRRDLRVRSQTVPLPLRTATAEDVASAAKTIEAVSRGEEVDFEKHVVARKQLVIDRLRHRPPLVKHSDEWLSSGLNHTWAGIGEALPVEVQAICIGDELAIVCLPGEVFVELGLAIKRGSPFRTTLVIELSNAGETFYVPTRAAYAQGSYEVLNSSIQAGSGEMLVEAALTLLRAAATEATAK